eukprot:scaffold121417_cov15-Tisochrysis_lutea.AAC.1
MAASAECGAEVEGSGVWTGREKGTSGMLGLATAAPMPAGALPAAALHFFACVSSATMLFQCGRSSALMPPCSHTPHRCMALRMSSTLHVSASLARASAMLLGSSTFLNSAVEANAAAPDSAPSVAPAMEKLCCFTAPLVRRPPARTLAGVYAPP